MMVIFFFDILRYCYEVRFDLADDIGHHKFSGKVARADSSLRADRKGSCRFRRKITTQTVLESNVIQQLDHTQSQVAEHVEKP